MSSAKSVPPGGADEFDEGCKTMLSKESGTSNLTGPSLVRLPAESGGSQASAEGPVPFLSVGVVLVILGAATGVADGGEGLGTNFSTVEETWAVSSMVCVCV